MIHRFIDCSELFNNDNDIKLYSLVDLFKLMIIE